MRSLFRASLMVCLALFVFAPFVVHAQGAATSAPVALLQPGRLAVKEGDVFNVSVVVENLAANDGMVGAEFMVTWNNTFLKALNIYEVLFHEITPQSEWDNIWITRLVFNNTMGIAEYVVTWFSGPRAREGGYCPINGISGNCTLAILTMEAVRTGSTSLQLPHVIVADVNANPLIEFGEMIPIDSRGNLIPRNAPSVWNASSSGSENATCTLGGNLTWVDVTMYQMPDDPFLMPAHIAPSQENVTQIQYQEVPEFAEMPLVMLAMLATISGVLIALPARWKRAR